MREQRGVTLITVAVTLIILLILAGVVISTVTNNDGQINQVITATKKSIDSNVSDAIMTMQTTYVSKSEFIKFLKDKAYINEENKINVNKLLDSTDCEYGVGENKKDVYILTDNLELKYYDQDGNEQLVSDLGTTMEP